MRPGSEGRAVIQNAQQTLDAALTDRARRLAPAALAAVAQRGEIIVSTAYGEPRRDGARTSPQTVFRVASVTKSFLAATALSLRDDGLLDLHAPVADVVPQMAAARYRGAPVRITLADLLSNRSGLPEDNPWGDEHLGATRDEIGAHIAAGLQLSAPPATTYQYSNVGMSLVGRAIERVTGRGVEDVVTERILAPLELRDTRWSAAAYSPGTDLAGGFRTFDDGASFTPEPYVGSGALACIGSLFSTVTDIARWMGFLGSAFDDGPAAEAPLTAASRREMQRLHTVKPVRVVRFGDSPLLAGGYGYGLVIEHDEQFGVTVGHSGGLPGFAAHMRWHPASGLGVVAFGNSDEFPAWEVTATALGTLLGQLPQTVDPARIWPATLHAAGELDALIRRGGSFSEVAGLFSRNVLRDVPAAVRDERLRALVGTLGVPLPGAPPLEERLVAAPEASTLRWDIPTERGALRAEVLMMGLHEPIVQAVSVVARPTT